MVSAIILAGGKGKRMGKDISKQFILVKDKPIIYYTIKKFSDWSGEILERVDNFSFTKGWNRIL